MLHNITLPFDKKDGYTEKFDLINVYIISCFYNKTPQTTCIIYFYVFLYILLINIYMRQ